MKEILLLSPAIKETIWGGRKLIDDYGFETDKDNAAEGWMLSCHKDGPSVVLNGSYKGKTFADVIRAEGSAVTGTHDAGVFDFPVLIKIIDACDKLSVQVHPGDEYAMRVENEYGKTEAWYILAADEGAKLVYGVNRDMTREEFSALVEKGELDGALNFVEVKPGDVVFIPSGMLHAIGAGILLAEVQQSSNTTYRVYDYNRRDKNGNLRELHVKKATDVVDLKKPSGSFAPCGEKTLFEGGTKQVLTSCGYFTMTSLEVDGAFADEAGEESFVSLLVLEGEAVIKAGGTEYPVKKGSSVFIPAAFGGYVLEGKAKILETRI